MKMKKILAIVLSIAIVSSMCGCVDDNEEKDDYEKDSKSSKSYDYEKDTAEEDLYLPVSDAYDIAEAYVPQAILNSWFSSKATDYVITDYEYEGTGKDIDGKDEHKFIFYGIWYEYDHYGNLEDYGEYYARIDVGMNGYVWGSAYPQF
ncbi:MAG: hypothetical protein IJO29_07815 [Oscillospiraceae bacterium]|nr:hypothetical protein [Oscillospiraceae bacterium]